MFGRRQHGRPPCRRQRRYSINVFACECVLLFSRRGNGSLCYVGLRRYVLAAITLCVRRIGAIRALALFCQHANVAATVCAAILTSADRAQPVFLFWPSPSLAAAT